MVTFLGQDGKTRGLWCAFVEHTDHVLCVIDSEGLADTLKRDRSTTFDGQLMSMLVMLCSSLVLNFKVGRPHTRATHALYAHATVAHDASTRRLFHLCPHCLQKASCVSLLLFQGNINETDLDRLSCFSRMAKMISSELRTMR